MHFVRQDLVDHQKTLRVVRREFLLIAAGLIAASAVRKAWAAEDAVSVLKKYNGLIAELDRHPNFVTATRGVKEYLSAGVGLEAAPTQAAPSSTKISARATDLLIRFEVSGEQVYERRYRVPTWPGGRSGVTIGIGYDLGYATPYAIRKDWQDYLSQADAAQLAAASGITGNQAKQYLKSFKRSHIPYSVAKKQFLQIMQPRYVGITERALPNFNELNEDCRGALVSLVYNRGASFNIPEAKDPMGRYAEMRAIKQSMATREYSGIPAHINAMARLWDQDKGMHGLVLRRNLEATLFLVGLQTM
ncbi:hypothetical protein HFN62_13875 [Rhizobium leguminosarum]|uniref:hypothetical protein n=1 Tax=Rhizobium leguminosarum TaxID=384 RepID=UPI001C9860CD|nr:hypothetical protein [Rhizobium leguminosarum]MBY5784825.1 hypothetical protein [Rhizobium leguminosarum]